MRCNTTSLRLALNSLRLALNSLRLAPNSLRLAPNSLRLTPNYALHITSTMCLIVVITPISQGEPHPLHTISWPYMLEWWSQNIVRLLWQQPIVIGSLNPQFTIIVNISQNHYHNTYSDLWGNSKNIRVQLTLHMVGSWLYCIVLYRVCLLPQRLSKQATPSDCWQDNPHIENTHKCHKRIQWHHHCDILKGKPSKNYNSSRSTYHAPTNPCKRIRRYKKKNKKKQKTKGWWLKCNQQTRFRPSWAHQSVMRWSSHFQASCTNGRRQEFWVTFELRHCASWVVVFDPTPRTSGYKEATQEVQTVWKVDKRKRVSPPFKPCKESRISKSAVFIKPYTSLCVQSGVA